MSRNVAMLTDRMQMLYLQFSELMVARGIPFMVTRVDCTLPEQMALYVQGRLPIADVNRFRQAVGLYPLRPAENKPVTWTLNSLHVTNPFDAIGENDKALAFDIAIMKGGKPTWDLKVSVNHNEVPDYLEAGEIWEALGGVWGGRWGTPDPAHFQDGGNKR